MKPILALIALVPVAGCTGMSTATTAPAATTNVANASEEEYSEFRFDCKALYSSNGSVILQLELPDRANEHGYAEVEIALHGEVMDAYYLRVGLGHQWNLASNEKLQIHMDAELHANYYDFRNANSARPETMFECRKIRNRKRR